MLQTALFRLSWLQLLITLSVLLVLSFGMALQTGPVDISLAKAVNDKLASQVSIESLILFDVRLPRALLALLIGGTLGLAGAALQGLLRNPLAEPGIVGVSNFAALGAVIAFYFGLSGLAWYVLPLGGLLGAMLSVVLVFLLVRNNDNTLTLILAGIAMNAIGSALIALALNFAPNPYAMQEILFWLMGSVSNRSLYDVYIALPFILLGALIILSCGRFLSALSLGEETAQTLGFNVKRMRWRLILGVAAAVGAAVSVSGTIGFIGLVVPHLLRPLVGHQPKQLLIPSFFGGAILLLIADICVQLLSTGGEMKLGVVTALVGGPFFLMLILKMRVSWL